MNFPVLPILMEIASVVHFATQERDQEQSVDIVVPAIIEKGRQLCSSHHEHV